MNTIWFDMDGTIYELFQIPNWLHYIESGRYAIYNVAGYARTGIERIANAIAILQAQGWRVGVLTWADKRLAKDSERIQDIADIKHAWLRKNVKPLSDNGLFFCFEYGKDKAAFLEEQGLDSYDGYNILVDDNALVRDMWERHGEGFKTIDASIDFIEALEGLIGAQPISQENKMITDIVKDFLIKHQLDDCDINCPYYDECQSGSEMAWDCTKHYLKILLDRED